MKARKHYTTGEKIRSILILIGIAANLILWGAVVWQRAQQQDQMVEEWSIPMANQHITWTGAGYDGIWKEGAGK